MSQCQPKTGVHHKTKNSHIIAPFPLNERQTKPRCPMRVSWLVTFPFGRVNQAVGRTFIWLLMLFNVGKDRRFRSKKQIINALFGR